MPIPLIIHGIAGGISSIPYIYPVLQTATCLTIIWWLKRYFGGATNPSVRVMHSKVVMVTGGTSGIGAAVVKDLASRGAQIILLTQHSPTDPFLVDYIEDLRSTTDNELIYAEQVDLSSLYSIRLFATKWIDNAPARRLDMVILCANTMNPSSASSRTTTDGLSEEWQINYLANYHLLSILSPALRAQPPDRDVRVIFCTCSSYIGGHLDFNYLDTTTTLSPTPAPSSTATNKKKLKNKTTTKSSPIILSSSKMYATSKLALTIFARSFQQHLANYKPPSQNTQSGKPAAQTFPTARVLLIDPGFSRTPGTRRWLTGGSLWGLLLYLLTWPIWWLILKSPEQGAQSILMAAMEARFSGVGIKPFNPKDDDTDTGKQDVKLIGVEGGTLLKECKERPILRGEVMDEEVGARLWEFSQKQIEAKEKEGALKRAIAKKEEAEREKKEKKEMKDKKKEKVEGKGNEKVKG